MNVYSSGRHDILWTEREYEDHTFLGSSPLTNPANPILEAARIAPGANIWYADLSEWPSPEQIEHARKVLNRLSKWRDFS